MYKLIQDMMPSDMTCTKETRELLTECCVEFIHLISSEANDICEKSSKKTISPEHVISAMQDLGFSSYIADLEDTNKEHKDCLKNKEKKVSKLESSGIPEEELIRQQEELFNNARKRFQGQPE